MPRLTGFLLASFSVLFLARPASAVITAGTGVSSVTSGRLVPALSVGYFNERWGVSGASTGVSTPLYYHSAWTVCGLKMWRAGELGSGPIDAGLGVGLFFAKRGFRETTTSVMNTADDFNLGPSFRVSWNFVGPAYIAFEAMYGFRKPALLIALTAQDSAHVTLGVAF